MIKKLLAILLLVILPSFGFATMQSSKKNILVIAETGGGHESFTAAALHRVDSFAKHVGMSWTRINDASIVNDQYLSQFAFIIQLDYPPYGWGQLAEKAFERYIDEGRGGWIGFHHAALLGEFDGNRMWHWFSAFLGGIRFDNYIAGFADASVRIERSDHPVMKGVDHSFVLPHEEWYTFDRSPRPNVSVLANVDENSYRPASQIRMGDHPVVWTNPVKPARNIYFLMGHDAGLFSVNNFCLMFDNAMEWVAGGGEDARNRYPANYAREPRFRVLAYYSEHVEEAHLKFAIQGVEFFRRLNYGKGFELDVVTDFKSLSYEKLSAYDLVIMLNNAPGSDVERENFQRYMENGGGWLGFHAAAYNDKNTNWPWFVDFLGGGVFHYNNWPPQPVKLEVDYPSHPVTRNLPQSFIAPESEWYAWQPSPRLNPDVDVLLTLSRDNYPLGIKDVMMWGDIPVVWTNRKYRMIYLNMGHGDDEFSDATQKLLFVNAFRWVMETRKSGNPFLR
jgi:type 1 glutamine amidotransferase